jgi:hypothetical protein
MSNLSLPIIEAVYQCYKELFSLTCALPKKTKYSLGQGIESSALSLLENLIYSKNSTLPMRKTYLHKTQVAMEILQLKLRLLLELKLANETKIFQIQARLEESGRMLGGWLKATN